MANLWVRKPIALLKAEAESGGEHSLKRTLTALNLTSLGIGAIIGAGIFVLTGHAAASYAGPAVAISFVVGGIACAFAGLCYAEMASTVPIAGIFRLRSTRQGAERPYRAFGYPVIPALYIIGGSVILMILFIYQWRITWPGLVIVATGFPVYYLWRAIARRRGEVPASAFGD